MDGLSAHSARLRAHMCVVVRCVCIGLVLWTCLAGSTFSESGVFALVGRTNGLSVRLSGAREPPIERHKGPDGRDTRLVLSARIATRAFSTAVTAATPDVCAPLSLAISDQYLSRWREQRSISSFWTPKKCLREHLIRTFFFFRRDKTFSTNVNF